MAPILRKDNKGKEKNERDSRGEKKGIGVDKGKYVTTILTQLRRNNLSRFRIF